MNKNSKQVILVMAVLLCILTFSKAIWASNKEEGALLYNIPIINGTESFIDVLEYPAYIAIALQNIGISISLSSKVKIKDHQTFEIKGSELKFIKKEGNLYFYQAKLSGFMGNMAPIVDFIVDVSTIKNGVIALRVSSSVVKILPMSLIDVINTRISLMSNEYNQKKILEYYNKLSIASYKLNKIQGISEKIMIDAYNIQIKADDQIFKTDSELSKLNYYSVVIFIVIFSLIIIMIYRRTNKS